MFGFGKVIKKSRHDRANGVFFSFFCLICKKTCIIPSTFLPMEKKCNLLICKQIIVIPHNIQSTMAVAVL